MQNYAVRNGLLSGGVQVAVTLLLYFVSKMLMFSLATFACFIVYVGFMRQTVIQHKRDNDGYISFRQAFKESWLTYIPGAVILAVFSYVFYNFLDPELLQMQRQLLEDSFEMLSKYMPMSEEEYEKQLEVLETQNPYGLQSIAIGLPFSFLFPGALIAAIIGLVMKKEHPLV